MIKKISLMAAVFCVIHVFGTKPEEIDQKKLLPDLTSLDPLVMIWRRKVLLAR